MTNRPPKLTCKFNKDGSISVICRGKVHHRFKSSYLFTPMQAVEAYLKCWFGEYPVRVNWKF